MALYKESDIVVLSKNLSKIMEDVERKQLEIYEPTRKEQDDVMGVIIKYIQDNKRKVYGGYGLNLLIKNKSEEDMIYTDDKFHDIDFYSPMPKSDGIKISNILYSAGFPYVNCRDAQHDETVTIIVNNLKYCDITYVPTIIYNAIPFENIDNFCVVGSEFVSIDYLRMFSDPVTSYWRISEKEDMKAFKRFYMLQKYYPFYNIEEPLKFNKRESILNYALEKIFNFLVDHKTCIIIGLYAYNYYLYKTKQNKNLINIPWYDVISVNYVDDGTDLVNELKKDEKLSSDISHVEYYPFFQFTGHNVEIYYGDFLLCRMYNNNNKCIQFNEVPCLEFGETVKKRDGTVLIGSFHIVLLYSLILVLKAKTVKLEGVETIYKKMISKLIKTRNSYLKDEDKTIIDKTLFREFFVNCIGKTILPDREKFIRIAKRKREGKYLIWSYDPETAYMEPSVEIDKYYNNTSGNNILNTKNLKLKLYEYKSEK